MKPTPSPDELLRRRAYELVTVAVNADPKSGVKVPGFAAAIEQAVQDSADEAGQAAGANIVALPNPAQQSAD